MKKIFLYTGTGAYQAKDIENFLAVFDFAYRRLHESELVKLTPDDIFIVPGGEAAAYLRAWSKNGIKKIRNFVSQGGIYIGICAGAYVAGKRFRGAAGLNFFENELTYTKSQKVIEAMDASKNRWKLISENGPNLSQIKADSVILKDRRDKPQAVRINFGKGQLYVFASHPEGSVFYEQLPQRFSGARFFNEFLKSLQNASENRDTR